MQTANLLNLIALGEDSQHQFKSNVTRSDALAQEMVAEMLQVRAKNLKSLQNVCHISA